MIAREVRRAGLGSVLGTAGTRNSHGEVQQKLDLFAHEILARNVVSTGQLCALASEEEREALPLSAETGSGPFALAFDPLDGSSNLDFGVSVGTIFGIHQRVTRRGAGASEDLLQAGKRQVAAGYVVYGSSTMFVYTTGAGVHGFTLDPTIGEFVLSHPNIRTPTRGRIYSVNEANRDRWEPPMRQLVEDFRSPVRQGGACTSRYVGSLVADFHRNLLAGGIFLYPGDSTSPQGKLRLLYEAAPLALIAEQAGGRATSGRLRILDVVPNHLHQRVPLILGSAADVRDAERFLADEWRGKESGASERCAPVAAG